MGAPRSASPVLLALALAGCGAAEAVVLSDDYDASVWTDCESEAARAKLAEADGFIAANDRARAIPALRRVVELCPRHVRANVLYQDLARRAGGDTEAAMRVFYEDLPDEPFRPEVAWFKARLIPSDYLRIQALEALVGRDDDFAPAHLSLARLNRKSGGSFLEDAEAAYERVLSIDPDHVDAHRELADLQVELGKFKEARRHYENAVRGRPTDRESRRALVRLLLYETGDHAAAEGHLDELMRLDRDDPDLLMDLGALRWRQGRYDDALAAYREVLRREVLPRAVLNIANLHYDVLATDEASRREHWPTARRAYLVYERMGKTGDGMDAFDQMFSVPYRLREIEKLLGPYRGPVPKAADL